MNERRTVSHSLTLALFGHDRETIFDWDGDGGGPCALAGRRRDDADLGSCGRSATECVVVGTFYECLSECLRDENLVRFLFLF